MATKQKPPQGGSSSKKPSQLIGTPNKTLYVTNLPSSKIRKPDLRTSLYTLFSTFGPVLDVVALLTMKMRGQAHIAFRDLGAATQALRSLQGFDFFGRELRIEYARSESQVYGRLEGKVTVEKVVQPEAMEGVTNAQREVFGTGGGKTEAATEEKGKKRVREDSDAESMGEAEMEVDDDDSDAPMEDSSDDD
ncbi:MAG: U2 snRNP complex subunit msl1 [Vezdaea aestivalis]|nr:MAG: U2 snRNP complex subunit msl1 [Vezdaea aestivalis]